jgi:DME family drug/metabolite transporter
MTACYWSGVPESTRSAGSGPGRRPGRTGLLAGLGIGPTALAYTLYYRGLRSASPTTAALPTLLEPLTAALLGAAMLGDRLSAPGIAGAVLLAVAVISAVRLEGRLTGVTATSG